MTFSGAVTGGSGVPYYSQWESPELVGRFIDGSLRPAEDPRWAASGACSPAEYEYWSTKACGLACLKMILGSRALPVPPLMRLVERALAWRAYLPQDGRSFSKTATWLWLAEVNGARSQLAQRSRTRKPVILAIRSSSDGHTYR